MAKKGSGGQLRKTAAHSAIYAIGTMISRITGLVMLPIYTRYLTPSDYGVIELLTMAIEISGILIGLRISQAMFRFYILAEDEVEKKEIISTVLLIVLTASGIGAAILYLAAEPLSVLIFGTSSYLFEFQLFAFTLMTNATTAVGKSYIRAKQMPILYVSIGAISLAIQVALNVIFVVVLEMHVRGVVYSALGSGAVVATGFFLYIFGGVGFHYSREIAWRLIRFVAPLVLASIGAFYVSYADKYFIRLFGSLTEVGLYAIAARISAILGTIYQSFNMTWSADRFEIVKREDARVVFKLIFRFLSAALIISGVGLALFAGDLLRLMANQEYYSAGNIVPFLVAAGIIRIFSMFCNFGVMLNERTRYIAEATWIKVLISSFGYIVLIPYLGVYGAAIALLVSNLGELYWVNRKSTREYDMGLQWKQVSTLIAAGISCITIGFLMPDGGLVWFVVRVSLYLIFIFLVYSMPIWQNGDRELMKEGLNKVVNLMVKRLHKT